jgi:hypothetical protein
MYREPHLQKKSEECKVLWKIWYELLNSKDPLASTARKTWIKCADEFSEMINQECLTNPKYKNIKSIDSEVT